MPKPKISESTGFSTVFGDTSLAIGVAGRAKITHQHHRSGDTITIGPTPEEQAVVYHDAESGQVGVLVSSLPRGDARFRPVEVGQRQLFHRTLDPRGS